jgi:hypothetical protein
MVIFLVNGELLAASGYLCQPPEGILRSAAQKTKYR